MIELTSTVEELAVIAEKWLQEAIDVGVNRTNVKYTAGGMALHMLKEMEILDR